MKNNQGQVYEQISDDENQRPNLQNKNKQQGNQINSLSSNHQVQEYQQKENHNNQNFQEQTQQQEQNFKNSSLKSKILQNQIDHQELGKYANLQKQNEDGQGINVSVVKTQKRGGIMSNYYVYHIEGYDKQGHFCIARRFNQFFQMRVALVSRWPGCFVPSIPAKNALSKNDAMLIQRRMRYLNDFVKKIAKLSHLYYGEQFQTLLRSQEQDISETFSKWSTLKSEQIINKYRISFSWLAGKQLNYDTNQKINSFIQFIKKNQSQLAKDREVMKQLAESNDKVVQSYKNFITDIFISYQKQCFSEYCNQQEKDLLYLNDGQIKLQEHPVIIKESFKNNPYWSLYDMIRHQQRDGLAFVQALQAKNKFQTKKHSLQIKISENQKNVAELSMGKKPFSTITTKGTAQQIKYKLEVQIQELKRQKQSVLIIIDIISALITYVEIQRYKQQKKLFYQQTILKIGSNQINEVQSLAEMWNGLKQATTKRLEEISS